MRSWSGAADRAAILDGIAGTLSTSTPERLTGADLRAVACDPRLPYPAQARAMVEELDASSLIALVDAGICRWSDLAALAARLRSGDAARLAYLAEMAGWEAALADPARR